MGFEPVECEVLTDIRWETRTGQLVYSSGAMGKTGGGAVKHADLGSCCNSAMSEVAEIA